MRKLAREARAIAVSALIEGEGLRVVAQAAAASRMSIEKLLQDLGAACLTYQDEHLRQLACRQVECVEIWSFASEYAKPDVADTLSPGVSDIWTWAAIDIASKLVPTWHIGHLDSETAHDFVSDLADRLEHGSQLVIDGSRLRLEATDEAQRAEVDLAALQDVYGKVQTGGGRHEERRRLGPRSTIRRFGQITRDFERDLVMHGHVIAVHSMAHNFLTIDDTTGATPAMSAGVADRFWEVDDLVGLLETREREGWW